MGTRVRSTRVAGGFAVIALTVGLCAACATAGPSAPPSSGASSGARGGPTATAGPAASPSASATPIPGSTSTTSATGTGDGDVVAAACPAGVLTAALVSRPMDSGMSSFYWDLTLTNGGADACTVTGYPGVHLVNAGTGALLGPAAEHERYPTVTEGAVELAPGASAYSLLHLTQAGVHDCALVPVTELEVTPPGTDTPRRVATPNPIQGCDDTTTGVVRVGPFAPASLVY